MWLDGKREVKVMCKRKQLQLGDHQLLDKIKFRLNQIKSTTIKTPIITENDFYKLEEEAERE